MHGPGSALFGPQGGEGDERGTGHSKLFRFLGSSRDWLINNKISLFRLSMQRQEVTSRVVPSPMHLVIFLRPSFPPLPLLPITTTRAAAEISTACYYN